MSFIKSQHKTRIKIASFIGWFLFQLIGRTCRIKEVGAENFQELDKRGDHYILCLWHGRMFVPIYVQRGRNIVAMVSQAVDGEIIARAVEMLGYQTVRGSSSKGGQKALRDMVKIMRKGFNGAMMPDGPKGPRGDFKIGTLILAQLADAYLVPMTHTASKSWDFNSWDKYKLAKPFSKVVVAYGEPVKIPRDLTEADLEKYKAEMEKRMNALVDFAEKYLKEEWC